MAGRYCLGASRRGRLHQGPGLPRGAGRNRKASAERIAKHWSGFVKTFPRPAVSSQVWGSLRPSEQLPKKSRRWKGAGFSKPGGNRGAEHYVIRSIELEPVVVIFRFSLRLFLRERHMIINPSSRCWLRFPGALLKHLAPSAGATSRTKGLVVVAIRGLLCPYSGCVAMLFW